MRRKIVAGNWKLQGSRDFAAALVAAIKAEAPARVDLIVLPPYPYLGDVLAHCAGSEIAVGAQDVSAHAKGAYTGEVAAAMLADVGCEIVIVAHSERRRLFGASTETAGMKMRICIDAG